MCCSIPFFWASARIVDFGPKELESLCLSVPGSSLGAQVSKINDRGKRKVVQVYRPMDKYILGRHYDAPLAGPEGMKILDILVCSLVII